MSILPPSLVNEIAESFGYQLLPEASSLLLEDSEFRLRQVLQESFKFLRNSKTQKLLKTHINSTLKVKNLQKIYGNDKVEYCHQNNIFYQKDAEIDLEELVNLPLPEIGQQVTFTAHWLAIEGVQPRIVQNPTNNPKLQPTANDDTGIKNVESGLVKAVLSRELQVLTD
jgi:transcription initiation factor TFIID subunit 6